MQNQTALQNRLKKKAAFTEQIPGTIQQKRNLRIYARKCVHEMLRRISYQVRAN